MGVPMEFAMSIPSWKLPHLHSYPDVNMPVVGATAFGVTSFILSIRDVILFLTSGFSSVWVSVFTTASSVWACAVGVVATMVVVARIAQVSVCVLVFMAPFLLCSFCNSATLSDCVVVWGSFWSFFGIIIVFEGFGSCGGEKSS